MSSTLKQSNRNPSVKNHIITWVTKIITLESNNDQVQHFLTQNKKG